MTQTRYVLLWGLRSTKLACVEALPLNPTASGTETVQAYRCIRYARQRHGSPDTALLCLRRTVTLKVPYCRTSRCSVQAAVLWGPVA